MRKFQWALIIVRLPLLCAFPQGAMSFLWYEIVAFSGHYHLLCGSSYWLCMCAILPNLCVR